MIKNIIKTSLAFSLAVAPLASCYKDWDGTTPLNNLGEIGWLLNDTDQDIAPIIISLNKYISFMDVSQGYTSHMWEVSEDGTYFLNNNDEYTFSYSTTSSDYINFVDESVNHTNSDETIHVWFTEAGSHTVRLRNTYTRQVTYKYSAYNWDNKNYDLFTIYGVKEGDEYVFDTTFTVDVYSSSMAAAVEVYLDEACTQLVPLGDTLGNTTVEIGYGDTLFFRDISFDRPNYWRYVCTTAGIEKTITGAENIGAVTAIPFSFLTYAPDVNINLSPLNVTMAVQRSEDYVEDSRIPSASSVSLSIPLDIVVGASGKPLSATVAQVDQTNMTITLSNSEFYAAGASLDPEVFDINFTNTFNRDDEVSGSIAVASATVDSDDKRVLNLVLADSIYNTDVITVKTVDGMSAEGVMFDGGDFSLADEVVATTTYAEYYVRDFEDGLDHGWFTVDVDNLNSTSATAESAVTLNPLVNDVNPSTYCFCAYAGSYGILSGDSFTGRSGSYYFSCKYFVPDEATTIGSLTMSFRHSPITSWLKNGNWMSAFSKGADSSEVTGVWYEFSGGPNTTKDDDDYYPAGTLVEDMIMKLELSTSYTDTIYLDDFWFGYVEERPATDNSDVIN